MDKYKSRKYSLDENYFNNINNQNKAYILGLLLSDGYVDEKLYKIGFYSSDFELLKFIKDELKLEYKIHEKRRNQYIGYEIIINSKILYYDFMKFRKSVLKNKITHIPDEIPDSLIRHFIRGYFDGDGCIRLKNNKTQLSFDISSYENILKEISEEIDMNICKINKTKIKQHGNIYRVTYSGNRQCKKIYKYLYSNSNLFLKRKKDIFNKIIVEVD